MFWGKLFILNLSDDIIKHMKKAKIMCKDTNITTDHSCNEYLNFLIDENDIKKAVPFVKSEIQKHYLEYVDESILNNLSDSKVEEILMDWADREKIEY